MCTSKLFFFSRAVIRFVESLDTASMVIDRSDEGNDGDINLLITGIGTGTGTGTVHSSKKQKGE